MLKTLIILGMRKKHSCFKGLGGSCEGSYAGVGLGAAFLATANSFVQLAVH